HRPTSRWDRTVLQSGAACAQAASAPASARAGRPTAPQKPTPPRSTRGVRSRAWGLGPSMVPLEGWLTKLPPARPRMMAPEPGLEEVVVTGAPRLAGRARGYSAIAPT